MQRDAESTNTTTQNVHLKNLSFLAKSKIGIFACIRGVLYIVEPLSLLDSCTREYFYMFVRSFVHLRLAVKVTFVLSGLYAKGT